MWRTTAQRPQTCTVIAPNITNQCIRYVRRLPDFTALAHVCGLLRQKIPFSVNLDENALSSTAVSQYIACRTLGLGVCALRDLIYPDRMRSTLVFHVAKNMWGAVLII
jgi:hypothetical protein